MSEPSGAPEIDEIEWTRVDKEDQLKNRWVCKSAGSRGCCVPAPSLDSRLVRGVLPLKGIAGGSASRGLGSESGRGEAGGAAN